MSGSQVSTGTVEAAPASCKAISRCLHGLIEHLPKTHRYRVTDSGWRLALFCTRTYNRVRRPGLAQVVPEAATNAAPLRRCFQRLDETINHWIETQKVPA